MFSTCRNLNLATLLSYSLRRKWYDRGLLDRGDFRNSFTKTKSTDSCRSICSFNSDDHASSANKNRNDEEDIGISGSPGDSSTRLNSNVTKPLRPFEIEQYDGWLASTILSDSDVEPLMLSQLLDVADDECRRLWEEMSLGYPPFVQGDPQLRYEIAKEFYPRLLRYANSGNDREGNSNGCELNDKKAILRYINCMAPQEGIFCSMHALLQPGDSVIVAGPSYQSLSEIPRSIGCHVLHWLPSLVLSEKNGQSYFRFDPEKLQKLLIEQQQQSTTTASTRKKCNVVVNFPHNPTGALPTPNEWDEIIDICRRFGAYLFCDEMYKGLEHLDEEEAVIPLQPAVEAYENGISLYGLSKSFGLAGLRMGWIASRDGDFMKRVQQIKDYTTICTSAPTQVLSLIAVRNGQMLTERCQKVVDTVKKDVKAFCMDNHDVLEWVEPRAGSFVFPKLLHRTSSREYCNELLKNGDIMLLPSSLFEYGAEHSKDDSRIRISLGRKSIPDGLERWKRHGL